MRVVCCLLLCVGRCSLLVVGCLLVFVCRPLSVVCCLWPVHRWLSFFFVCCLLFLVLCFFPSCLLFVVRCLLLVDCGLLCMFSSLFFVVCCVLFVDCCFWFAVCGLLLVDGSSLFVGCVVCWLFVVGCLLLIARC